MITHFEGLNQWSDFKFKLIWKISQLAPRSTVPEKAKPASAQSRPKSETVARNKPKTPKPPFYAKPKMPKSQTSSNNHFKQRPKCQNPEKSSNNHFKGPLMHKSPPFNAVQFEFASIFAQLPASTKTPLDFYKTASFLQTYFTIFETKFEIRKINNIFKFPEKSKFPSAQ